MRLLDDLSYYEILELSPEASPSEIRQAHQALLNMYQNDPIVADSFFNEEEKKQIIEIIDQALAVLNDPDKKAAYDKTIKNQPTAPLPGAEKKTGVVTPLLPGNHQRKNGNMVKEVESPRFNDETQAMLTDISNQETISGRDIRALRESLNLSVEKVFEITKIRGSIIQSIEEDRFGDLPPGVYLKSFLKTYAQVLQLPPDVLSNGYTQYMLQNQTDE